nr:hypothetical protein [uncultured Desulfobulbus sp.]
MYPQDGSVVESVDFMLEEVRLRQHLDEEMQIPLHCGENNG